MTADEIEKAIRDVSFSLAWEMHRHHHDYWKPEVALAWCHFRKTNCQVLATLAQLGWQPAHDLLCDMVAFLTAIGDPLPVWLQEYAVIAMRAGPVPARRGQHPLNNFVRDLAISALVQSAANAYRLRPTRNPAKTTKEFGCSIVQKALERLGIYMTETNVVHIWQTQCRLDRADTRRRYTIVERAVPRRVGKRCKPSNLACSKERTTRGW